MKIRQGLFKPIVLICTTLFATSCKIESEDETALLEAMANYETYTDKVGRSEMKVTAPRSKSQEHLQLAIYLHGDNATEYVGDIFSQYRKFALENGLVFAAIRAPNTRSWWTDDQVSFAFFDKDLDEVIGKLHEKHNLAKTNYLFSGVSGGSTFLTSVFVPSFGNKYPGTYVLNCGGARNNVRGEVTDLKASDIKMYYYYGDQDFLVNVINDAMNGYKKLNVSVKSEVYPNVKHCAYKTDETTIKAWKENIMASRPSNSDKDSDNSKKDDTNNKVQQASCKTNDGKSADNGTIWETDRTGERHQCKNGEWAALSSSNNNTSKSEQGACRTNDGSVAANGSVWSINGTGQRHQCLNGAWYIIN